MRNNLPIFIKQNFKANLHHKFFVVYKFLDGPLLNSLLLPVWRVDETEKFVDKWQVSN